MFKGMKRVVATALLLVAIFSLALSGCATTGAEGTEGTGGFAAFIPLILIIVIFYFILIRPQNKKNKQINEMRNALKRGDFVTTIGGFKGRVVRVGEDDLVVIEVGADKTKLEIMRWGISKIEEGPPPRSTRSKKAEKDEDEAEEEAPKRKPRKLAAAPKKEKKVEEEVEDLDAEELLEENAEFEEEIEEDEE